MDDQQNQQQGQQSNSNPNPNSGAGPSMGSTQEKMKEHMTGLEGWLGSIFANAPHIPENGRKVIVEYAPWVVLIFGILGVVALLGAGGLSMLLTIGSAGYALPLLITVLISLASAALLLMSYPGIKAHKKSGWNLVFYSQVVGIAGSIVSIVMGHSYNIVGAIIGAIIGFWILFEVRSHYKD